MAVPVVDVPTSAGTPFCYYEAAANMLTNPVLDPFGKIPEFKYCAVKLSKGGAEPKRMSFGGGVLLPEPPAAVAAAERSVEVLEVGAD